MIFITQIFWVLGALIDFFRLSSLKEVKINKSKIIKYKGNPFNIVAYYANLIIGMVCIRYGILDNYSSIRNLHDGGILHNISLDAAIWTRIQNDTNFLLGFHLENFCPFNTSVLSGF